MGIYVGKDIYKSAGGGGGGGGDAGIVDSIVLLGQTIPVVKIGNQYWTAENLDVRWDGLTVTKAATVSTSQGACYYGDNQALYGLYGYKLGLLYNGYAARAISNGILENGWRLPSYDDFVELRNFVGATNSEKLKDSESQMWMPYTGITPPTNETGFSALPSGRMSGSNTWDAFGQEAYYWISNDGRYEYEGMYVYLSYDNNDVFPTAQFINRSRGQSIRLVCDA